MTTYNGTAGRDLYTGGNGADLIFGFGGDDKLAGGDGNDTVVGGEGADELDGGDGDDVLFSAERVENFGYPYSIYYNTNPPMDRGAEIDRMTGGAGDDYIFAGVGDFVDGGAAGGFGNRLYISFQGATAGVEADFSLLAQGNTVTVAGATIKNIQSIGYLEGSNFDDTLRTRETSYPSGANVYGRGGNDHIFADYYSGWAQSGLWGGDGDDVIDATGAQYGPKVYGEAGDDVITMRSGLGDYADGGDGNDIITAGGQTSGGAGDDLITMQFTYYSGTVTGDAGDDEIHTASSGNNVYGGDGADRLIGANAGDMLVSGSSINANGDSGTERDVLSGGGGADRLFAGYGDTVDGGAGNDTLSLSLLGASHGVRLATGAIIEGTFTLDGGTVTGVETLRQLTATNFADRITLSSSTEVTVHGMGGNDTFFSGDVATTLFGDDGNDTLVSGAGADRYDGGDGVDTVDYSKSGAAVSFALGNGTSPGATGDTLISVEAVIATRFADELVGNSANNRFVGGAGADSLSGAGGDDRLDGGAGRDTLSGGDGKDDLYGGADRDTLTGGADRDVFHFAQADVARTLADADTVVDFTQGDKDKLDLSGVDAVAGTDRIDGFAFIGTAAFSGAAGEVRYGYAGKSTIVSADTDGDGAGDVFVRLGGHVALTAKDFVFAASEAVAAAPHEGPAIPGDWAPQPVATPGWDGHVMLV